MRAQGRERPVGRFTREAIKAKRLMAAWVRFAKAKAEAVG